MRPERNPAAKVCQSIHAPVSQSKKFHKTERRPHGRMRFAMLNPGAKCKGACLCAWQDHNRLSYCKENEKICEIEARLRGCVMSAAQ